MNDQVVLSMDLLPTFLDFIDQKPTEIIDGQSIKDNLLHQTNLPERDVFFAYGKKSFIRSGDWKLICTENKNGKNLELYNLANDINERNDMSSDRSDMVSLLLEKLEAWEKEVREGVIMVAG